MEGRLWYMLFVVTTSFLWGLVRLLPKWVAFGIIYNVRLLPFLLIGTSKYKQIDNRCLHVLPMYPKSTILCSR